MSDRLLPYETIVRKDVIQCKNGNDTFRVGGEGCHAFDGLIFIQQTLDMGQQCCCIIGRNNSAWGTGEKRLPKLLLE